MCLWFRISPLVDPQTLDMILAYFYLLSELMDPPLNKHMQFYKIPDKDYLARTPTKTHKSDEKWPLYVNKQLFWWSASITLDNNNILFVSNYHQSCPGSSG